jgi:hypothetical protein
MCRNIKTLHHFAPPATEAEVRASALQYVRKLSGMRVPSKRNQQVFDQAVDEIAHLTLHLLEDLEPPQTPPRTREEEARKARERGQKRERDLAVRLGR